MNSLTILAPLLRLGLGWIFFWPFLDKLLGLGFTTCRNAETGAIKLFCDKAWLQGGSPTVGFLKFGTHGPFANIFQSLAGISIIDWLFMLGLFAIGLSLLLGIMTRLAVFSGILMLILMYLAALPPEHNPIIDDHIIYSLVLLALLHLPIHKQWSLAPWWKKTTQNHPWLQ